MKNHFKELLYYSLRAPTALLGLFCIGCAFTVDLDTTSFTFSYYLIRITIFFTGVYILYPNYLFRSNFWYNFRLCTMVILGSLITFFAIKMILDYSPGEKDFAMVPIGIFILYSGLALPITVWLRKITPNA